MATPTPGPPRRFLRSAAGMVAALNVGPRLIGYPIARFLTIMSYAWLGGVLYRSRNTVVLERSGAGVMEKVNLAEKLDLIREHWRPELVGELNGQEVKLVKCQGTFVWHQHEREDELFLGVRGRFRVEFRDRTVELGPGEFIIVPHGVEHRTVADSPFTAPNGVRI